MDKKWRNLIILVVLVIVIVLGYFYFFKEPDTGFNVEQINEDKEYLALVNLFDLSEIDVLIFRSNELVISDSNELNLVYSKDKLILFSNDLNDLRNWAKTEINSERYVEFNSLIDIYQAVIKTNILLSDFSKNFNLVIKNNYSSLVSDDEAVYCEFVGNNYPGFTNDFEVISESMLDLSEKNYSHFEKYGVLIVDYDFNSAWDNLNYTWTSIFDDLVYCDQRGLVK